MIKKSLIAFSLAAAALTSTSESALILHYTFDSDASDAVGSNDLTAQADDSTNFPTIQISGGKAGGYASFDGQNYFNRSQFSPVSGDADRTFSMFVRTTADNSGSTGGTTTFFGGWGDDSLSARVRFDLGLQGGSNNQLRGEYNSGASTSLTTAAINTGVWRHLAIVWDGGTNTATFYLDGAFYGSETETNNLVTAAPGVEDGFFLGTDTRTNRFFTGDMDDVRVYDEALDATAIANLAAVPEPSSTALLGLGGLALMLRRRRN